MKKIDALKIFETYLDFKEDIKELHADESDKVEEIAAAVEKVKNSDKWWMSIIPEDQGPEFYMRTFVCIGSSLKSMDDLSKFLDLGILSDEQYYDSVKEALEIQIKDIIYEVSGGKFGKKMIIPRNMKEMADFIDKFRKKEPESDTPWSDDFLDDF